MAQQMIPDIRTASSIIDYIFRRLGKSYLSFDDQLEVGLASIDDMPVDQTSLLEDVVEEEVSHAEQEIALKPVKLFLQALLYAYSYAGSGRAGQKSL
jgi:hypothetical protein